MAKKQEGWLPITNRLKYTADFDGDFGDKINFAVEMFDRSYCLTSDFKLMVNIKVGVQVYSAQFGTYQRYISEVTADLSENTKVVLSSKDFRPFARSEDKDTEMIHNLFMSTFKGVIQFEVV